MRLLDAAVRVTTDGEPLVRLLREELGPLVREARPADRRLPLLEVRFSPPPPRIAGGDEEVLLDPARAPEQAFGAIFRSLLDRVAGFLVLHAAAVERDGRAFLVAGPSGTGKTTLALGLLERGWRLLSDDFAPLERGTGLVHPLPKPLGIRPGEAERTASPWLAAGALPPELLAREPAPLGGIALVGTGGVAPAADAPYRYGILLADGVDEAARRLAEAPGVTILERTDEGLLCEIDPRRARGAELDRLLEELTSRSLQHGVLARPHGGSESPRLVPLPRSEAVVLLLRELQNRRRGNALARAAGDDPARLALELAAHLAGVPVTGVIAGEARATVELLDRWFRDPHLA